MPARQFDRAPRKNLKIPLFLMYRAGAVSDCRVRGPQSKGGEGCKLLCSGHPLMFLSRPVRYVGMPRGWFCGFDSKTDAHDLCDQKFSPSTQFVAQRKGNVPVSQPPDLALRQPLNTKH